MPGPWSLLRYFASGLLMGGADIIPGVSGGTMALIVGVYEDLVSGISSAVSFGLALLRLDTEAATEHWREIPWSLIVPLGAGIAGAIAIGARVLPALIEAHPHEMRGLFLGLVAASLVIPALRMRTVHTGYVLLGIGCAGAAFYLTGLPLSSSAAPALPRVFLSAAVAICAMILPGISGAFLLEVMGIYEPTLEALRDIEIGYVLTFIAGAAAGLGTFAKLLDWLLEHRHDATMAALIGLIAGALRALWPYGQGESALRLPEAGEPVGSVIGLGLAGLASVLLLVWMGRRDVETAVPDADEGAPAG